MKSLNKIKFGIAVGCLAAFVLWTIAVCHVDLQPIGPEGSRVGFATVNGAVHRWTGVNWELYTLTDLLSIIPLGAVLGFALLGLCQWIGRKDLRKVDADILLLGGFYVAVMALFVLFEAIPINYRPVLIEGVLEASYPSSTTLLVLTVMPTAGIQLKARIRSSWIRRCGVGAIHGFTWFMVAARLLSGVHWCTDIVGGILLAGGLVCLYDSVCDRVTKKEPA